ncbi:MAG: hypothetical protein K2I03_08440 [Lachnospiraceae bacterium]|nr:hypothetical protein [Lachnospiraceae bacterium]
MRYIVTNRKTKRKQECSNEDAIKTLKKDDNFDIKEIKEKKVSEPNSSE